MNYRLKNLTSFYGTSNFVNKKVFAWSFGSWNGKKKQPRFFFQRGKDRERHERKVECRINFDSRIGRMLDIPQHNSNKPAILLRFFFFFPFPLIKMRVRFFNLDFQCMSLQLFFHYYFHFIHYLYVNTGAPYNIAIYCANVCTIEVKRLNISTRQKNHHRHASHEYLFYFRYCASVHVNKI